MFYRSLIFVVGLVVSLALAQITGAQPPADPTPVRAPVPSPAEVAETGKLVRNLFKLDYAKPKIADQIALAKKLLKEAEETKGDSVGKFVLYREAREVAAKAGDVSLALEAATATAREFEVDLVEVKLAALEAADKSPSAPPKEVAEAAVNAAGSAAQVDNYTAAGRLLKIASSAATRARITTLSQRVTATTKELEANRKAYEELEVDRMALTLDPSNTGAAERVGRYLCLAKGDWAGGLPLLAKGANAGLKATALKDIANPPTPTAQVEVGDAWWELAEGLDPAAKLEARLRACHWYQQASGEIAGLSKVRVDKRLAEMAKVIEQRAVKNSFGGWAVLFRSDDPSIWNTNTNAGRDRFAILLSKAPSNVKFLKMTGKDAVNYIVIEMTNARLATRTDSDGYGWNGTNELIHTGDHLGIYNTTWTDNPPGAVTVAMLNLGKSYRGWGFGHKAFVNDGQAHTWNGMPVEKTVFEIAVKSAALTADETKHLLGKKK